MNKLDALIGMADLRATDTVLEIGCGWGSLAIRAVQASCTGTRYDADIGHRSTVREHTDSSHRSCFDRS